MSNKNKDSDEHWNFQNFWVVWVFVKQ